MKILSLGEGVSLASAAAQTGVATNASPFFQNREAVVVIALAGVTGSPTVKVQSSEDNSTWTDEVTVSGDAPVKMAEVRVAKYMRLNVTAAGTAGTCNAYLMGDA